MFAAIVLQSGLIVSVAFIGGSGVRAASLPSSASNIEFVGGGSEDDEDLRPPSSADRGMVGRAFYRVGAGGSHIFRTDMDAGGRVQRSALAGGVGVRYIATERLALSATLGYELESYRFRSSTAFGGRGWGDVHHVILSGGANLRVTEEWSIFGSGSFRVGAEDGASWSDALSGNGLVGAVYQVQEGLTLGAGFGVQTRIEQSSLVIPALIVDWKFADQWRLVTTNADLFYQPGAEVVYEPDGDWTFGAGFSYLSRGFRLSEGGQTPDGVGSFAGFPVYVRATWKPAPRLELTLQVGGFFAGKAQLRDRRGDPLGKDDLSAAPMIQGMFQFRF